MFVVWVKLAMGHSSFSSHSVQKYVVTEKMDDEISWGLCFGRLRVYAIDHLPLRRWGKEKIQASGEGRVNRCRCRHEASIQAVHTGEKSMFRSAQEQVAVENRVYCQRVARLSIWIFSMYTAGATAPKVVPVERFSGDPMLGRVEPSGMQRQAFRGNPCPCCRRRGRGMAPCFSARCSLESQFVVQEYRSRGCANVDHDSEDQRRFGLFRTNDYVERTSRCMSLFGVVA